MFRVNIVFPYVRPRCSCVSFNAFDNVFQHSRAFSHPFKCFSVLLAWEHDFGFQNDSPASLYKYTHSNTSLIWVYDAPIKNEKDLECFSSYIFHTYIWDLMLCTFIHVEIIFREKRMDGLLLCTLRKINDY